MIKLSVLNHWYCSLPRECPMGQIELNSVHMLK